MTSYSNIKLDEQQLEAVNADGNVVVAAVPGSGKTAVITHRVARLIKDGVAPERILAVSFQRKAAEVLNQRITDVAGNEGRKVETRTFHSLGAKLLREYGDAWRTGLGRAGVLDEMERRTQYRKALRESAKELGLGYLIYATKYRQYPSVSPRHLEHFASSVYDLLLDLDSDPHCDANVRSLTGAGIEYEEDKWTLLWKALQKIDASKLRERWITFDDMLQKTCLMLSECDDVRYDVVRLYDHVLVDEYQDTNPAQQMMVDLLAANAQLVLVGDDDQTIYSWRRANPSLLIEATKSKRFQVVKLERNYRSDQPILDVAQRLIGKNEKRIEKRLVGQDGDGRVVAAMLENEFEEARWVVTQVLDQVRDGIPLSQVMILARTNAQLGTISEVLVKEKIPHQLPPKANSFADLPEVKDMEAYVQLAVDLSNEGALDRIVNRPWRGLPPNWIDACSQHANKLGIQIAAAVPDVPAVSSRPDREIEGRENLVWTLRASREAVKDGRTTSAVITSVITQSGYRQWIATDENDEDNVRLENLEQVLNLASRHPEPLKFLQVLKSIRNNRDRRRTANRNAVMLSTIHRAKGLESDVVFLLGCKPGRMPHRLCGDNIEEERRLCYVAITRARRKVFVSRDENPVDCDDTRVYAVRFLNEMNVPIPKRNPDEVVVDSERQVTPRTGYRVSIT